MVPRLGALPRRVCTSGGPLQVDEILEAVPDESMDRQVTLVLSSQREMALEFVTAHDLELFRCHARARVAALVC